MGERQTERPTPPPTRADTPGQDEPPDAAGPTNAGQPGTKDGEKADRKPATDEAANRTERTAPPTKRRGDRGRGTPPRPRTRRQRASESDATHEETRTTAHARGQAETGDAYATYEDRRPTEYRDWSKRTQSRSREERETHCTHQNGERDPPRPRADEARDKGATLTDERDQD
jgi:hypothetical protein